MRKENVTDFDSPTLTFYSCQWSWSDDDADSNENMMITTPITTLSCSSFEYFTVQFRIKFDPSNCRLVGTIIATRYGSSSVADTMILANETSLEIG